MGCAHLISFPRLSAVRLTEAQTGLLPVQVEVSASVLAALIWMLTPAPGLHA